MEQLPIKSDSPAFKRSYRLDGIVIQLAFQWSDRRQLWTVDVLTDESQPILAGRVLVAGRALFLRARDPALPPGELILIDTHDEGATPGRNDLGDRHQLIYVLEAE